MTPRKADAMTTHMTHTPGPWSVIERADTIDGEPVIYVGQPDRREAMGDYRLDYAEHDVARVFTRDDARLIAQAPAMLAWFRSFAPKRCVRTGIPPLADNPNPCGCGSCAARAILRAVEG